MKLFIHIIRKIVNVTMGGYNEYALISGPQQRSNSTIGRYLVGLFVHIVGI
jgi:hypothetical protein